MWQIKEFQTLEEMERFIRDNDIQYEQIFIDNVPYSIEYKYNRYISF